MVLSKREIQRAEVDVGVPEGAPEETYGAFREFFLAK
jgi:hypothetical protein